MVVIVDKEDYDAKDNGAMTVEKALEETAEGGRIGNLRIDPKSLTMRAPGNNRGLHPVAFFSYTKVGIRGKRYGE